MPENGIKFDLNYELVLKIKIIFVIGLIVKIELRNDYFD